MPVVNYTVKIVSSDWDFGSRLAKKDVRIVAGGVNAARNADATVKLFRDGSGVVGASDVISATDRNITRLRLEGTTIAYEVEWTNMTAPIIFTGIQAYVFIPEVDVL